MKEDQEQKCHVCRFCDRSFSNGKQLGGHMRCHLALIDSSRKKATKKNNQESINGEMGLDYVDNDDQIIKKSQGLDQGYGRKQGILENDQEFTSDEKGLNFDDDDSEMVKKSQQEMDFDQDYGANVYGLRENPKRSWRVSNSSDDFGYLCEICGKEFSSLKALTGHKSSHSRKESIKNTICEKCGKAFDSMKALYGHMRSHSIKRSQAIVVSSSFSSSSSSSEEHDDDDGGIANPVRKKRSCTRYNSPMPNNFSTSLSSQYDDNEDEVEGAICLMMLSRGLRNLDGVKLGISNQAEIEFSNSVYSTTAEKNVEFEVSVDGSVEFCEVKNKCKVGMKKDLILETGSGQMNPGRVVSTLVKYKSTKKIVSCDQDFEDRDAADSGISLELKRRSKEYICPICFKKFGCSQGLGSHKRVHNKTENEAIEINRPVDISTFDLNFPEGIKNGDVEFKLMWIQKNTEWDPLSIRN